MDRTMLRDDQWERIEQRLPGKKSDPGCAVKDNRRFVEAVLWIMMARSSVCKIYTTEPHRFTIDPSQHTMDHGTKHPAWFMN